MKVVINYQEYNDVEIEKAIIRKAFPDIDIIESNTVDPDEFIAQARDVDAALIQYVDVNEKVIDALEKCRGYVRFGIAYNNINAKYAAEKNKAVANVPHYCIDEVSNHALAMIMALNRKLLYSCNLFLSDQYELDKLRPVKRLKDSTVGIVGLGNIGKMLVDKMQPLVKKVLMYDPYVDGYPGCEKVELDELCKASDYLSLHLPLIPQTKNLINRELLESLPQNASIINTGRGGTLDEDALADLLQQGKLGGAGLDVFAVEPLPQNSPLRTLPNVILTSHNGWYSEEAIIELKETAARQAVQILNNEQPECSVI